MCGKEREGGGGWGEEREKQGGSRDVPVVFSADKCITQRDVCDIVESKIKLASVSVRGLRGEKEWGGGGGEVRQRRGCHVWC